MNTRDLTDLKEGTYLAYSELFSTEVYYSPLLTNSKPANIYNEDKNKQYGTPIKVVAKVDMNPKTENISMIGQTSKIDTTFDFPLKSMELASLDTVAIKELKKGRITYKNFKFEIVNITPSNNIGDVFLNYIFECKGVE